MCSYEAQNALGGDILQLGLGGEWDHRCPLTPWQSVFRLRLKCWPQGYFHSLSLSFKTHLDSQQALAPIILHMRVPMHFTVAGLLKGHLYFSICMNTQMLLRWQQESAAKNHLILFPARNSKEWAHLGWSPSMILEHLNVTTFFTTPVINTKAPMHHPS